MDDKRQPKRDSIRISPIASHPGPKLLVSVIGGAYFSYRGQELEVRNRKARALFGSLALSQVPEASREQLAGMFWSEFGEQNARATLRQAIHEFRESLEKAGCLALSVSRMTVGLRPSTFSTDLDDILAAVERRRVPAVLLQQKRLSEMLLAGLDDLDPAFHVWLTARRQALHDRLVHRLEESFRHQSLAHPRRSEMARAALLLDPAHEEACRVAMRCAAETGETGAAIRLYDDLYRYLDEYFDIEPSLATQQLIVDIKQGRLDPPVSSADTLMPGHLRSPRQYAVAGDGTLPGTMPPSMARKPALIVSRFVTNGLDIECLRSIGGFRIELISCLTRFREWYVAGSESELDQDAARPVSVRYKLNTTVYQAGATMTVAMVLQERPTGLAIWGERFELRLDQWPEARHRIVSRIAATLSIELPSERLMLVSQMPDTALECYDAWQRGQWVTRNFSVEEWDRVAVMLSDAIRRAPDFSSLYSGLAQLNSAAHWLQPGLFRDPVRVDQALKLARQARDLDPRDSRAELALGWALANSDRFTEAQRHIDLACQLNANDSWTLVSAALFHAFSGHVERACALSAQAMQLTLSPTLRHWVNEVSIRYLRGDDAATLEAADQVGDSPLPVLAWRAAALANLGRPAHARQTAARFLERARKEWVSDTFPSDELIGRWLMHAYPISQGQTRERLQSGLTAAGIPACAMHMEPGTVPA